MKLKLTTWERLTVAGLIGRLQGDARLMHKAIKVFDAVELSEEERQEVNVRQVGDNLVWDNPTHKWDISIPDREAANLVRMTVQNNKSWVAAKAREVSGLHEALGLEWPPVDGEVDGCREGLLKESGLTGGPNLGGKDCRPGAGLP